MYNFYNDYLLTADDTHQLLLYFYLEIFYLNIHIFKLLNVDVIFLTSGKQCNYDIIAETAVATVSIKHPKFSIVAVVTPT